MSQLVTLFVHEVDTEAHPTVPPGWRWAVHLGGNPHDLTRCVQAGWVPNDGPDARLTYGQVGAEMDGSSAGMAAVNAVWAVTGVKPTWRTTVLDRDPIEAGNDPIRIRG